MSFYNHLGPEGNYLGQYGYYFTDRYRTPWLAIDVEMWALAPDAFWRTTATNSDYFLSQRRVETYSYQFCADRYVPEPKTTLRTPLVRDDGSAWQIAFVY